MHKPPLRPNDREQNRDPSSDPRDHQSQDMRGHRTVSPNHRIWEHGRGLERRHELLDEPAAKKPDGKKRAGVVRYYGLLPEVVLVEVLNAQLLEGEAAKEGRAGGR